MLIAGSCSYVLTNKIIPKYQRDLLYKDFFSLYPQNSNLQAAISEYPDLQKELGSFETARKLILHIIETS